MLELDDIQSGVLRPRPCAVRGDLHPAPHRRPHGRARADAALERGGGLGRAHRRARRATPGSASRSPTRASRRWACPQDSLDSFAWEFRQGMAARAKALGRHRREQPRALGKAARDARRPRRAHRARAGRASGSKRRSSAPARRYGAAAGGPPIWRQDCHALPTEKEPFGFRDGISHPAIEGSGIPGDQSARAAAQGGRVRPRLPRRDGRLAADARPEVLGRNGTYVVFRKLHQRVAAFRRYSEGRSARPRRGRAAGGQDDGAMAQRRASGALPAPRRSRSWAPTRGATTTSCYRGRRDGIQDAARLAHPARESARRVRRRRRPAPPDDPPRDRLRARAAGRVCSRTTASIAG